MLIAGRPVVVAPRFEPWGLRQSVLGWLRMRMDAVTRTATGHVGMIATSALFLGSCVSPASPAMTPTSTVVTTSPSLAPAASSSVNATPALNPLEVKIIEALARLGISGQRAELHPLGEASIWAKVSTGDLFVNAGPIRTEDFVVADSRRLEGSLVERGRYSNAAGTSPLEYRFECIAVRYHAKGPVPPGFADMDTFVGRLIRALACGG
ncbi:MAG TPA: hypothetical protein VFM19_01025 [Candidatus Limnocylindria bacterium]|nr:hypothetical protein [Candidatus Limnocylindria bacterium]